jgi:hypothetical protein
VVVLGLVAAVVLLLVAGDDDPEPATANEAGPSPEYVTAIQAPIRRLTDSAEVTGRVLARASRQGDLARVGRMATQQLVVVQAARTRIADIPAGSREVEARGALSRATQAHRTYLASLSRLPAADPASGRERLRRIRADARRTLAGYRAFYAQVPDVPKGITAAGLSDLSGLAEALQDKQRAAEESPVPDEPSDEGGGGDEGPDGGPVVSNVATTDRGGFVEISARYCDRTPGAVNDFVYTFRVVRDGVVLAENSYAASQTRACNDLYQTFDDSFALGSYEVQVVVENLTNNVSGSAVGTLRVIN